MPKFILALACVSFLTIVLSGFHLHADVGGHDDTASHAQDLHHAVDLDLEHELDHESEHIDVSVFETARGFANVDTAFPVVTVPDILAPPVDDVRWSKDTPDIIPRRYSRLRPAPRAPPVFA